MSQNNTTTTTVGSFPLTGLLGVVFVTLKLCNIITWPWIWVTAPFWGGFAFLVVIVIVALVFAVIAALLGGINNKPRLRAV